MKRHSSWYLFFVLTFLGTLAVYFLYKNSHEKAEIASKQRLEYIHNRAVSQFTSGVERMSGLVASMKAYVNMSETFPSQNEFKRFVTEQLDDVNSTDSIVVSVIDTAHIFRQSFTRSENDPVKLLGKSVRDLRSVDEIAVLDELMQSDEIKMFPPINLREGWLGIPINFRIYRKGKVEGYVAPIIQFSSISASIYDTEISKNFVFKFSGEDGNEFDRVRSYNGTEVYNDKVDQEFYQNFQVSEASFIKSTKEYFGFKITIATAYKKAALDGKRFRQILFVCYGIFLIGLFVVTWQVDRYVKLNRKLEVANNEIAIQNKELENLNQTKNRFFTMISHDVKQPLSAVEGLLGLLQEEKSKDPSINSLFEAIRKSTRNTVSLLNNLLRWALSQTGELNYEPVIFNLSKVIEEVVVLSEQRAIGKSITIVQNLDDQISFKGDIDMIKTVLRNLISNAIKFTEINGKVTITSTIQEDKIHISIQDNGIGMESELASSLFQIGETVSREGTSGEIGTGLGLILSKDFIEKHNGYIYVSSALGEGTTFKITLPVFRG